MRRVFVANSLAEPPVEERIAPGGSSSSHTLNAVLEEIRQELDLQRESVEQALVRNALHESVQTSALAVSAIFQQQLNLLLQQLMNGNTIPISFYLLDALPSWTQVQVDEGMLWSEWGAVTAPVASRRTLVYEGSLARSDLVLQAGAGSTQQQADAVLYTLTPNEMYYGRWLFPIPTGNSGKWVRLRFGLSAGGFDELANLCGVSMLPGCYSLYTARVRDVAGAWHEIDLSGLPWSGQPVSDVLLHWNPSATGAVDGVELLLRRMDHPDIASNVQAMCITRFDLWSVRFERSGTLSLQFNPARTTGRADLWRIGSSGGVRVETGATGIAITLTRETEWYSPLLKGMTLHIL